MQIVRVLSLSHSFLSLLMCQGLRWWLIHLKMPTTNIMFKSQDLFLFSFFLYLIYLILEWKVGGRGREREKRKRKRERILSSLYAQCRTQCGAQSHNPGIMTWAQIKSQRLSYPGAPQALLLNRGGFTVKLVKFKHLGPSFTWTPFKASYLVLYS